MTDYANWDDKHGPAPSPHAPRLYSFVAAGTETQDNRLVISEEDSPDGCMASGAYIAMDTDHVLDLPP